MHSSNGVMAKSWCVDLGDAVWGCLVSSNGVEFWSWGVDLGDWVWCCSVETT